MLNFSNVHATLFDSNKTLVDHGIATGIAISPLRLRRSAGGTIVQIENHPYVASVRLNGGHHCGGTILTENIILTSAHCTDEYVDLLSVKVGSSDINFKGSWHPVERVLRHDDYEYLDLMGGHQSINDVALIKLKTSIQLDNSTTRKIKLAHQGDMVNLNDRAKVVGWGDIRERYTNQVLDSHGQVVRSSRIWEVRAPVELTEIDVEIASMAQCLEFFPTANVRGQFCTKSEGRGFCSGDSGGPLIEDGRQIGIVSWGSSCHKPSSPRFYTDIGQYRDWIDQHVKVLQKS
ncbi:hypothetical protein QAD02_003817 [Eretmocerus hayati]|uniref:Uncharacterized protein n=1 Tax=Eretmocerus hayati TaxID=131215 RepID=A0ACC2NP06_9HYME|nr:hypothetical protein QAD02_003817 [Eretmocerus hayati]